MGNKHKHHIRPRHTGGTDAPSNLVELTVVEHAEAHRLLFEEEGRWQDRVAWMGLSGMIGREEVIRQSKSEGGKLGCLRQKGLPRKPHTESHKKAIADSVRGYKHTQKALDLMSIANSPYCYIVIDPNGTEEKIRNLDRFCKENNLATSHMCNIANGINKSTHKGYSVRKISLL